MEKQKISDIDKINRKARISQGIKESGKNQRQISDEINVKEKTLSAWVKRGSVPNNHIALFCKAIDKPISWVLDGTLHIDTQNNQLAQTTGTPLVPAALVESWINSTEKDRHDMDCSYIDSCPSEATIDLAMELNNNTMSPTLPENSTVHISLSYPYRDNSVVLVKSPKHSTPIVRRLSQIDGKQLLTVDNPGHAQIFNTELTAEDTILGVIVQVTFTKDII